MKPLRTYILLSLLSEVQRMVHYRIGSDRCESHPGADLHFGDAGACKRRLMA